MYVFIFIYQILCSALQPDLITATLEIFTTVISRLLPTPSKSHYTFNLRDFSRVIEGILLYRYSDQPVQKSSEGDLSSADSPSKRSSEALESQSPSRTSDVTTVDETSLKETYLRLWTHEVLRVFYDRLVDDMDRMWFLQYTKQVHGPLCLVLLLCFLLLCFLGYVFSDCVLLALWLLASLTFFLSAYCMFAGCILVFPSVGDYLLRSLVI